MVRFSSFFPHSSVNTTSTTPPPQAANPPRSSLWRERQLTGGVLNNLPLSSYIAVIGEEHLPGIELISLHIRNGKGELKVHLLEIREGRYYHNDRALTEVTSVADYARRVGVFQSINPITNKRQIHSNALEELRASSAFIEVNAAQAETLLRHGPKRCFLLRPSSENKADTLIFTISKIDDEKVTHQRMEIHPDSNNLQDMIKKLVDEYPHYLHQESSGKIVPSASWLLLPEES